MTARNISILNATYSSVPAVQLPISGGGTATFTEITDTTATASDVATGKYFYTSAGVKTAGTMVETTEYDFTTTITPTLDSRGVSFYNYAVYPTDTSVLTNDNILKMRAYLQNGTTLYPLLIVQTYPSSTYAVASVKSFFGNPQNTSSTTVSGTLHFIAPFEISRVITSK